MSGKQQVLRYRGRICLSARSIQEAFAAFDSTDLRAGRTPPPLSWQTLQAAMSFLENLVLAEELAFDGSLPKSQIERIEDGAGLLRERTGIGKFALSALEHEDPSAMLKDVSSSAREMRLHVKDFSLVDTADMPLLDGHERFVAELQSVLAKTGHLTADRRRETARRIAEDLVGEEKFRGSKCIAAMALGGPELVRAALELYERHAAQAQRVSGALINRFRLPYVTLLSNRAGAIHQPDARLHSLSDNEVETLGRYLVKNLRDRALTGSHEGSVAHRLREETALPPLGLLLLLRSKSSQLPEGLLAEAWELRRKLRELRRYANKRTANAIAKAGAPGPEDTASVGEYVQNEFAKELDTLKKSLGEESLGRFAVVKEVLLPSLATAAGVGLTAVLFGGPQTALGLTAMLTATAVSGVAGNSLRWRLQELARKSIVSHLHQYKGLRYDVLESTSPVRPIPMQVERVFGRLLQPKPSP